MQIRLASKACLIVISIHLRLSPAFDLLLLRSTWLPSWWLCRLQCSPAHLLNRVLIYQESLLQSTTNVHLSIDWTTLSLSTCIILRRHVIETWPTPLENSVIQSWVLLCTLKAMPRLSQVTACMLDVLRLNRYYDIICSRLARISSICLLLTDQIFSLLKLIVVWCNCWDLIGSLGICLCRNTQCLSIRGHIVVFSRWLWGDTQCFTLAGHCLCVTDWHVTTVSLELVIIGGFNGCMGFCRFDRLRCLCKCAVWSIHHCLWSIEVLNADSNVLLSLVAILLYNPFLYDPLLSHLHLFANKRLALRLSEFLLTSCALSQLTLIFLTFGCLSVDILQLLEMLFWSLFLHLDCVDCLKSSHVRYVSELCDCVQRDFSDRSQASWPERHHWFGTLVLSWCCVWIWSC